MKFEFARNLGVKKIQKTGKWIRCCVGFPSDISCLIYVKEVSNQKAAFRPE